MSYIQNQCHLWPGQLELQSWAPHFKVPYLGWAIRWLYPIPLSRVHRPRECAHQILMSPLDHTLNTGNLETPYSDGPTATPRVCTAASIIHLHRSQLTVTKLPQVHRKCRQNLYAEAGTPTGEETTVAEGCRAFILLWPWPPNDRCRTAQKAQATSITGDLRIRLEVLMFILFLPNFYKV